LSIGHSEISTFRKSGVEEVVTRKSRYAKSRRDLDHKIVGEPGPLIHGEEISTFWVSGKGSKVTLQSPDIAKPDAPFGVKAVVTWSGGSHLSAFFHRWSLEKDLWSLSVEGSSGIEKPIRLENLNIQRSGG
jgi:hypothetical protein